MRLDGYGLFVRDMAVMIRFYRDVLGFEIREDEDTDNVYLLKDGTLFLLYGRNDFEKLTSKRYEYLKGVNAHSEMALYVDTFEEVDEQYQNAIRRDFEVERSIKQTHPYIKSSYKQSGYSCRILYVYCG